MKVSDAINYLSTLPRDLEIEVTLKDTTTYISRAEVVAMGISDQLLHYHIAQGKVKVNPIKDKAHRYLLADVVKIKERLKQ